MVPETLDDGRRPQESGESSAAVADADDLDLMRAIVAGQSSALAELYRRHSSLVMAICRRVLNDAGLAEDVVVEVFWEIWEKGSRYNPERGKPRTYIAVLARSRAIDRKRQVSSPVRESPAADEGTADSNAAGGNPMQAAIRTEHGELVREAMQALTPPQRAALEMAFFEGRTHREIAELLQQPLGTVKTRIRKALLKLRGVLGQLGDERDGE